MDGALTVPPRVQAVPPVRNASASSMQSPPASADATRVISLSPVVGPPRRAAEIEVIVYEFPQAQVLGEGGRQEQAGIGHQAMVVKEDADAVGVVTWQHLSELLLFWDRFFVAKPLSQKHRSTFLPLQDANLTPSFGGFGLRGVRHHPGLQADGLLREAAVRSCGTGLGT